jgi:flagellar protein FlgJ
VAINPPSDIVLGVTLAADPQKQRAAVQRLQRMGADSALQPSSWRASVDAAPDGANARRAGVPASRAAVMPPRQARATDAFAQLEAFVLQRFVQSMLPKNAARVYGKGTAGEIWKSMLAEKLGAEIASSGQVGIGKRLQAAMAANRTDPVAASMGSGPPQSPSASLASLLPYLPGATGSDGAKS